LVRTQWFTVLLITTAIFIRIGTLSATFITYAVAITIDPITAGVLGPRKDRWVIGGTVSAITFTIIILIRAWLVALSEIYRGPSKSFAASPI